MKTTQSRRIAILGVRTVSGALTVLCSGVALAAEPSVPNPAAELPQAEPGAQPAGTAPAQVGPVAPAATVASPVVAPAAPPPALAPVAPAEAAASDGAAHEPLAGYSKGFFLKSADDTFGMKIGTRVQTRFVYEVPDGAPVETQFSIPRARLALSGHAFSKDLKYKFQADFGKGQVALKDFYTSYQAVPEWLFIQAGQAKKPFSRQQITSSAKLQFVDRAITDKAFAAGRDVGVTIHNNYTKSPEFEYAVGLYNGTGDSTSFSGKADEDGAVSGKFSNVPGHMGPAVAGRIGYNFGDYSSYSESDHKGGDLRFAIAASGLVDFEKDASGEETLFAEVDFDLKVQGFSATGAVYTCSSASKETCFAGGEDALGMHVQAGYLIAGQFEPVFRYAAVGNDSDLGQETEIAGGFSVYLHGHKVKLQTDLASLNHGDSDTSDLVSRTQFQFGF